MGCTASLLNLDSLVPLVFRKAPSIDCHFYLGSRHFAPTAHGSTDELCLEVYAADGATQPRHGRGLALFAARHFAMAYLRPLGDRSICSTGSRINAGMEAGKEGVSIC